MPTKFEIYWVAIPFPTREQAESMLAEADELGYRAAVVKADACMIEKYLQSTEGTKNP